MRRTTLALAALLSLWAARAVLAAAPPADVEKQVDAIIAKIKQPTADALWEAERQIALLGPDAVPVLKTQVAKARPPAQLVLAKALCSLGSPEEAIEPLVAIIRSKRSSDYAIMAAAILCREPARDVPATERELMGLADDATLAPEVTRAIARALYLTATTEEGLNRANATLRRLLVAAPDAGVRRDCAIALAEIDDFEEPVEQILGEMQDEPTLRGQLALALLQKHSIKALLLEPRNREGRLNNQLLEEVKARIQKFHVEEPLPDHELINAAARGMVGAVQRGDHPDRHSNFLDEDDWKKFREHISGHYAGIGAVVQFMKHFDMGDTPVFTVARPTYSGPAYKAGIRSYDRIIEVAGEPTAGKKNTDIVEVLRGKQGTPVEVTITSPGSSEKRKLTVVRADIEVPTVYSQPLPGRIGYVRLTSFGENSAKDLEAALRSLEKQDMAALILDLRNNPGGQLSTAVDITDKFLKDNKLIVYTEGRNKVAAPREEFRTKDPTTHPDYPMVVLVNAHSASASEIVAGALQDHQRATLIGTKTYGKGSVQKLFPLRATAGQSGLKLTIAKYYLPSGRSIHGKGVEPDVKVSFRATVTRADFDRLRETGAFHRYTAERFAKNKELFATLARFDAQDAQRYPDFDAWQTGQAGEIGRDKARRLLRAWLRILVADDRGAEFVCDFEEDNQLQRAILELAKQIKGLDPKAIPEYQAFASQPPPKEEPGDDNEQREEPEQ